MSLVEIASVFKAVRDKRPDMDQEVAERKTLAVICDELQKTGQAAVIVTRGVETLLPASDLRQAIPHYLADYSLLLVIPWELQGYQQGAVFISEKVKENALRSALEALGHSAKRGRPSKSDGIAGQYRTRFPNGHEVEGLVWKDAAIEIGAAVHVDTLRRALGLKK